MSLVLNVPDFWIYKISEYASGFEYITIMNIPEFWIWQDYQGCFKLPLDYIGFTICLNNSWIYLIMSGYAWICLNIAGICVNMPKSARMAFVLHFPISHICFTIPWPRGYLFEHLQEITDGTWDYFLEEQLEVFHLFNVLK